MRTKGYSVKAKSIKAFLLIIMIVFSCGCGRTPEPLLLPKEENVIAVKVLLYDGSKAELTRGEKIKQVLNFIGSSTPIKKESVNDTPVNVDKYGTITIETGSEQSVFYYYKAHNGFFLEQPYSGIYETEKDFEEEILRNNQ